MSLAFSCFIGSFCHLQIGIEPEFVIFFDCSEEEMIKRMWSRKQVLNSFLYLPNPNFSYFNFSHHFLSLVFCINFLFICLYFFLCSLVLYLKSREDDNVDTMKKRLEVYRQSSLPVIEYYNSRGMVRKVVIAYFVNILPFHSKKKAEMELTFLWILD